MGAIQIKHRSSHLKADVDKKNEKPATAENRSLKKTVSNQKRRNSAISSDSSGK
jgi:hypothetical protein